MIIDTCASDDGVVRLREMVAHTRALPVLHHGVHVGCSHVVRVHNHLRQIPPTISPKNANTRQNAILGPRVRMRQRSGPKSHSHLLGVHVERVLLNVHIKRWDVAQPAAPDIHGRLADRSNLALADVDAGQPGSRELDANARQALNKRPLLGVLRVEIPEVDDL